MAFTDVKSVIFDFQDNYGDGYFMGIRAVDFYNSSSKITLASGDITCYAASSETNKDPEDAFITALSKTGSSTNTEWNSGYGDSVNRRLIVVFDTVRTFDEIRVNNSHNGGSSTSIGVQNCKIHTSTDSITDTTYNAAISNSTEIFDDSISQHTASDVEDEEILLLGDNTLGSFVLSIPSVALEMHPPPGIIAVIPTMTMESSGISAFPAHAELNIPSMFLTMDSSQSETLDEFSMEIPSMTMAMNKAGDIAIEIPSMILLLEGKTNKIGNIKATIPSMTMQARTGANMEMELPPMFMDMDGSSGAVSVELTGDINFLIPAMRARITSVPDDVLETSIPMIEMAMEADQTGDNDLTLVIPPMVVSVDSGDIPSDELRYIRGLVR